MEGQDYECEWPDGTGIIQQSQCCVGVSVGVSVRQCLSVSVPQRSGQSGVAFSGCIRCRQHWSPVVHTAGMATWKCPGGFASLRHVSQERRTCAQNKSKANPRIRHSPIAVKRHVPDTFQYQAIAWAERVTNPDFQHLYVIKYLTALMQADHHASPTWPAVCTLPVNGEIVRCCQLQTNQRQRLANAATMELVSLPILQASPPAPLLPSPFPVAYSNGFGAQLVCGTGGYKLVELSWGCCCCISTPAKTSGATG